MCEANVELLERVQTVVLRAEANEATRGFAHQLGRALMSMRRYPLPLRTEADLRGLSGVNEGTAKYLARLAEDIYGAAPAPPQSLPPAVVPPEGRARAAPRQTKPRSYTPRYGSGGFALMLALHDAGALGPSSGLAKDALILRATPYSDTPFTASTQTGSRGFRRGRQTNPAACFTYTAWNSMKTLMGKGLVAKQRKVFFLTPPGAELAARLKGQGAAGEDPGCATTTGGTPSTTLPATTTATGCLLCVQCQSSLVTGARFCHVCGCAATERAATSMGAITTTTTTAAVTTTATIRSTTPVALASVPVPLPQLTPEPDMLGSGRGTQTVEKERSQVVYDAETGEHRLGLRPEDIREVVLLLDMREVGSRRDRTYFETHLKQIGCPCETRNLRLGDFVWVARSRSGVEYMLDHIIERKTFGDLCSSVRSEHLEDQKHRLHQCVCTQRTVLVESAVVAADAPYEEHKFSRQAFMSSLASTQFVHGFSVRTTLSIDDTVRYLAAMTRMLAARVRTPHTLARTLARPLTTYEQFDCAARPRALRVQDVFATQLLQLRRMPVDAALAVSAAYGNALALWQRYQRDGDEHTRSTLLQDLAATDTRRVGAKTSSNVATLFTCTDYDGASL